jgi:general stress protein YciG
MTLQAWSRGDELKTKGEEPSESAPPPTPKKGRGFAAMDRAAVRAIARKGGVAAHERGTAHRFTTEEAREAGRKGGRAPHRARGRKVRPSNGGADANGASTGA